MDYKRWTTMIAVLVSLGMTTPIRGQEFEVDDRVPDADCPLCLGVPHVGVITSVIDNQIVDGASESILQQGGLFEQETLFLDRDNHLVDLVPAQLVGADYVQTSQDNADWVTSNGNEIDIEIELIPGAILYLLIDTPEITNNGGFVPFHWMEDTDQWDGNVFFDTGSSMWSSGANDSDGIFPEAGSRQFYLYGVGPLDGGTYHIREQDVDSTYLSFAALLGATMAGDFDTSGTVDVADIDLLSTAIRTASDDSVFDLDGSGAADAGDLAQLVGGILNTWIGDANLDGEFNSGDLVSTFAAGQYDDAVQDNSGWATGDWNSDGDFNSADFVAAFTDGGYELGPKVAAANAVPEPASSGVVFASLLAIASFMRRSR